MTEATQDAVRFAQAPQRCPFCHSQVAVEHDRWVACRQCLARHHAACWTEGGACGACHHDVALSAEEAQAAPASTAPPAFTTVPGATSDEVARARRETAALFDKQATRERSWLDALLGPLSLGIYPAVMAERDLARHHDLNMAEEAADLPEGLDETMARRFQADRARGIANHLRLNIPILVTTVGALAIVGGIIGVNTLDHWSDRDVAAGIAVCGYYAVLLAFGGYLHVAREAVRGHELRQMYLRLVSEAAPKEKAERLLARTARAWNLRRLLDATLTVLALVPFFGLFLLPAIAVRYSGALSQHLAHEEELDVACPPRRRARKGS